MATDPKRRDQRQAPRIDVLMRIKGELTSVSTPILVHDLSRTGFAVLSRVPFKPGETLDFRLDDEHGSAVTVTARAVHSRPVGARDDLHLSGFMFVPGGVLNVVPQVSIDRLIAAVMPTEILFV